MIHPWHDVTAGGKLPQEFIAIIQILFVILPVVVSPVAAAQTHKARDAAELRSLMDVYARAVNEADAGLGSKVWCGSAEDSVTNPAGRWQGPQQIKAFYALSRDSYSERKLTLDDVSVHLHSEFAWTEFTGDFAAKQRKDGTPVSFHAVETQIYHRAQGKWCLLHVHYSTFAPPQTSEKK